MRSSPLLQRSFFKRAQAEVCKWRGTLCAHGYSSCLEEEVIVELKAVVPDGHSQEVPDNVFRLIVLGVWWLSREETLEHHFDSPTA